MTVAVDNDVVHKGIRYGLASDLCNSVDRSPRRIAVMGTARFVVANLLERSVRGDDARDVLGDLQRFLAVVAVLEPTEAEQSLAAEIEFAAQRRGLPLDAGESLLCAVTIHRDVHSLLTGDKRAIRAMQSILGDMPRLSGVCGKVVCLEQAVLSLVERMAIDRIRSAVCSAAGVDTALTMCFSCYAEQYDPKSVIQGLRSYIEDIRVGAPQILAT